MLSPPTGPLFLSPPTTAPPSAWLSAPWDASRRSWGRRERPWALMMVTGSIRGLVCFRRSTKARKLKDMQMTELEQIEKTPKKVPARQKSKKKEIPKASESDVELELTSLEAEDLQIKKPTSKSGKSKKELQMSPEESVLEKDETKLRSQSGPGQDKAVRAVDTEEFQADRAEAETKKCQTVVAAPVTAAEEEMEVSHTRGRTAKASPKSRSSQVDMQDGQISKIWESIQKKYGIEVEEEPMPTPCATFSTGSLPLDLALGVGGLPYGRILEVYGPETSGKTALALSCCISLQRSGRRKNCAFIDVEHAFDSTFAKKMGLQFQKQHFSYCKPPSAEIALDMAGDLAESNAFDLIVIDSVAALLTEEERQKDMTQHCMAARAQLLGQFMRKVVPICDENQTSVLCINQLRKNFSGYGPPEITTGGEALKYAASVRLEVRSPASGKISKSGEVVGIRQKVTVRKNKLAPGFRTAEHDAVPRRLARNVFPVTGVGVPRVIGGAVTAWAFWRSGVLGRISS
ncbi:Protein RecA (Recombinase A) [Durusdinium trenchii]|uniref:Protein RecA (Recombinase A) n=1 Tax=Durusdinium trenchii TaxID=1381693 RepID=A0ABP0LBS4_9DINO